METYDVRLLDTNYQFVRRKLEDGSTEQETIVKLFGRTRDDQSITILWRGFDPYFHVFDPDPDLRRNIEAAEGVKSIEDISLEYKGEKARFLKVTTYAPFHTRKLREDFELKDRRIDLKDPPEDLLEELQNDPLVLEVKEREGALQGEVSVQTDDRTKAQRLVRKYRLLQYVETTEMDRFLNKAAFFSSDIVFTNRFIYDMDLDACVRVTGERVRDPDYTTEIVLRGEKFERCDQFTPKLKVLSFDIENSPKNDNIYCIGMVLFDLSTGEREEHSIVSAFGVHEMSEEMEAGEDWAEDEARMLKEFIAKINEWDPDVITGYNIDNYDWQVIYERTKALFVEEKENEKPVNKVLLIGRDGSGLNRRMNRTSFVVNWDIKGRIVIDAWRAVKKEVHPKREGLGYVATQLFGDTKDNINSVLMDTEWTNRKDEVVKYCVKDAELAGRILLDKKVNSIEKLMDIAVPAKLPAKEVGGGQNRMIESLLIRMVDRAHVAVPTSGADREDYEGGFVYDTKPGLWDWVIGLDFSSMYPSQIIKHNICFTTVTTDPSKAGHKNEVTKAMFVPKETREGIVPRMAQGLLDARKQAKAKKKEAEKAGDKDLANYYDRLQAAIKVISNATYGYFGTKFCRWPYSMYIAPSITAWAREEIGTVIKTLEDRGCTVIAGDTDSIMFKAKGPNGQYLVGTEPCVEYGKAVQEEFSKGNMHLELEKVMERFFAHAKKRYFGKILWPKQDMIVRGYETRRTDSFDLQGETMTNVFNFIMDGMPSEAVNHAKVIVDMTMKGKIELNKLVISKGVEEEGEYVNPDAMIGVKVARKLKERGYEFVPGMKTPFVVTRGEAPMDAEPVIEGVEFGAKPDYQYYAKRLAKSLSRVTEAFGCDERSLLQGNSQKTLAKFFGED